MAVTAINAAAQSSSTKDVYLLIDVTGSMVGLPRGSKNRDVMRDLLRQVHEHIDFYCREGDRVHVATFRESLYDLDGGGERYRTIRTFEMRSDLAEASEYILSLRDAVIADRTASSGYTGIYGSMNAMLNRMQAEREARDGIGDGSRDRDHSQQLLVFTDGTDNKKDGAMEEVIRRYAFLRSATQSGERMYAKLYLFSDSDPPFSEDDLPWERRAPGARITAPVRVTPSAIELGNVREAIPAAIPIRLYPPDDRIRSATLHYAPGGALPPQCVTLAPTVRFVRGEGQLKFSFPECKEADRLLGTGGTLDLSGTVSITFNDPRFELTSPSRLRVTGTYSGTRDIAVHLRFDPFAVAAHGLTGIARTSDKQRRIPLLDARFSSLAAKDSLRVSLRHVRGTRPAEPMTLRAGLRSGQSVTVNHNAPVVDLLIPANAMDAGKALYELVVDVPQDLELRVVSDRGRPVRVNPARPMFRFALLGSGSTERPPLDPVIYLWSALIIALPAGLLAYFGLNRPPRQVRLTGPTLAVKTLRRAQGFFSDWVDVGRTSAGGRRVLVDQALPGTVFRIRSTRLNGTEIAPRAPGLVVDGLDVKLGEVKRVSRHSKIEYRFDGKTLKYELR